MIPSYSEGLEHVGFKIEPIPWPTYDRLGVNDHNHSRARYFPKSGTEKTIGKKYAASWKKNKGYQKRR